MIVICQGTVAIDPSLRPPTIFLFRPGIDQHKVKLAVEGAASELPQTRGSGLSIQRRANSSCSPRRHFPRLCRADLIQLSIRPSFAPSLPRFAARPAASRARAVHQIKSSAYLEPPLRHSADTHARDGLLDRAASPVERRCRYTPASSRTDSVLNPKGSAVPARNPGIAEGTFAIVPP